MEYLDACLNMDVWNERIVNINTGANLSARSSWFPDVPLQNFMSGARPSVGLVQGRASPVFGSPGNTIWNMHIFINVQWYFMCCFINVCVCCCRFLATYLPLPPSFPPYMILHACIHYMETCTHINTYTYMHQTEADTYMHIHRHTHIHTRAYIHIHIHI